MNSQHSKIESEARPEPAYRWILPMQKDATLNSIALAMTVAVVVSFAAVFAAQA